MCVRACYVLASASDEIIQMLAGSWYLYTVRVNVYIVL